MKEKDKYKQAYHYLLEYWESLDKEQQRQANNDLNKIFGKEHKEYLDLDYPKEVK